MEKNKYNLNPTTVEQELKIGDYQKLTCLAKEGAVVANEFVFNYDEKSEIINIGCGVKNEDNFYEYVFEINFYDPDTFMVKYQRDYGDDDWDIENFDETGNKYKDECKDKILKIFNYLIDNQLLLLENNFSK